MTPAEILDDASLDALDPEATTDFGRLRVRVAVTGEHPPGLQVLANLSALSDPEDLLLLADGLGAGGAATRATDAGGFRVDGDTVEVWDAGEHTVTVGRVALTRLMARIVSVAAESVTDDDLRRRLAATADSLGG